MPLRKCLCDVVTNVVKKHPTEWQKTFASHVTDGEDESRLYKELRKHCNYQPSNASHEWAK